MMASEVKREMENADVPATAAAAGEDAEKSSEVNKEMMEEDGEEVELSHREAMAVFKHGLAEIIEVPREWKARGININE